MPRLNPVARLTRRHHERGAVATIVTFMLASGVILGFAALSVDIGSVMFERRQLQNAADASALALAKTCAEQPAECTRTAPVLDTFNAANNFKDNAGGFDPRFAGTGVCGENIPTLDSCASGLPNAATGTLTDCPALPSTLASDVPYVEVHTQTRESGGSTLLPTSFIQTLTGGSGGKTVGACARAAYGAPGATAASAPITFSMCEWRLNTASGASYYADGPAGNPGYGASPLPPWPSAATDPPTPGGEIIITLQGGPDSPDPCPNFNGHDVPGGFGYIESMGCDSTIQADGWIRVDTGNSTTCDLAPLLGTVIFLPVFDCTVDSHSHPGLTTLPADCDEGTGTNTWYHIAGWAKFYLSGYKTGGTTEHASLVSGTMPCTGGERCISGWFLEGVLRDAPVAGPPPGPGDPGFGTYAIQPVG